MSYRIYENGKALKDLTENHGVILEDTPADYFTEYSAAAAKALQAAADENAFFAEVGHPNAHLRKSQCRSGPGRRHQTRVWAVRLPIP